jgi:hypothetical protein
MAKVAHRVVDEDDEVDGPCSPASRCHSVAARITANTAGRLGGYLGNRAQLWFDLQNQYEIGNKKGNGISQ